MHNIVRHRLAIGHAMAATALILGGCAQMTRHSNMLVFGTNTTVGVNVGKDATQTPTVQIGFNRQEAALVPLLANTSEREGNNGFFSQEKLSPCKPTSGTDCHFRADNSVTSDGGRDNQDSYSVLASFGSEIAGSSTAKVSVAQYFATGVAAQVLAETGGANIVLAGGSSKEIAEAAAAASEKRRAEISNAAVYKTNIDKGTVAAKTILGSDAEAVTEANLKTLADKIGVAGCSYDVLKGNDMRSVKQFLAEMKEKNFQCLDRLARKVG